MAAIENIAPYSTLSTYHSPPSIVQKRPSAVLDVSLYFPKNHHGSSLTQKHRRISQSATDDLNCKIRACATTSLVNGLPSTGNVIPDPTCRFTVTSPLRSKNAQEILEIFIALGRERSNQERILTETPRLGNPQHSFRLIPEDPNLISARSSAGSTREWIEQSIIQPGLKISAQPLSASQKTSFINAIKSTFLPRELHGFFGNTLKALDPKINSVHDYSNALIEIISRIHSDATPTSITKHVSSILIESILPAAVRKTLITSSIRIADTNWVDQNLKRIYVICFFDPVTNALSLGTINEDGSNLRPQDQNEWGMIESLITH